MSYRSVSDCSWRTVWVKKILSLLNIAGLALLYYAITTIVHQLELEQHVVMVISFTDGVGLVTLLLGGLYLWVGVLLGELAYHLGENQTALLSAVSDVTSITVQITLCAWLLKIKQFNETLAHMRHVTLFAVAVALSGFVGASIASMNLFWQGIPYIYIGEIWLIDWFDTSVGMLVVAPTILVWRRLPNRLYQPLPRLFEAMLMVISIIAISYLSLHAVDDTKYRLILLYLILPFAIAAAWRFEQHGATLAAVLISVMLWLGGFERLNQASNDTQHYGALMLLVEVSFIGISALTAYWVAAAFQERHQAEATLLAEKEQVLTHLQAMANGVLTTDKRGTVRYLNPAAEKLTGWSNTQAQGYSIMEVLRLQDLELVPDFVHPVQQGLQGMVSQAQQYVLFDHQQQIKTVIASVAPLHQTDGNIDGTIIVCHTTDHLSLPSFSDESPHNVIDQTTLSRYFNCLRYNLCSQQQSHALLYFELTPWFTSDPEDQQTQHFLQQWLAQLHTWLHNKAYLAQLQYGQFALLLLHCAPNKLPTVLTQLDADHQQWLTATGQPVQTLVLGAATINQSSINLIAVLQQARQAHQIAQQRTPAWAIFQQM